MDDRVTRRLAVPSAVVAVVLVGTAAIWEPLDGIFRRTVEVNNLFLGILAALTALGVAAFVLCQRVQRRGSSGKRGTALRALAIIEVIFLMSVWVTAVTTGAIGGGEQPGSGRVNLFRLED
jgi:hypothetical protein